MKTNQASKSSGTEEPPATDHREIEWQFDAEDFGPVEDWLYRYASGSSGPTVATDSTVEITDSYYDTDDWRLYRSGYALRVREADDEVEATMKSLEPAEGSFRKRREISEPLEDDKPATLVESRGLVGSMSRKIIGARGLRRLFRVRTRRQRFALRLDGSTGEVSLDASEIPVGEDSVNLRRVEVETDTAPTPGLRGFVDEMRSALDLSPATLSKYETGLYASGLDPVGEIGFGPTRIDPSMSVGEVAFAVLRRQFAEMRAHEGGTRLGEDPEELHDMRVPTRRMRAAIKVFRDALPERAGWFGEELRWVAQALGEVRDLDVQIERLEAWEEEADEETSRSLDKILGITGKRRAKAREDMLAALDSDRYEILESSFAQMLSRGPEREVARTNGQDVAGEPITLVAPALISRRFRKWRKAARRLDASSSPEAFHDARKKGKRLRYTLEFVSEVYGEPVQELVRPLKVLQDDLGDHQDAVVAAGYLSELGTNTGGMRVPRGVAFTMGVYSERCAREARDLRFTLPDSNPFRAMKKGKQWKEFEKVLEDRRELDVPNAGVR
ncbi:MAG TPA: CHAD domain-containing protein [Rubrobacter sp.]